MSNIILKPFTYMRCPWTKLQPTYQLVSANKIMGRTFSARAAQEENRDKERKWKNEIFDGEKKRQSSLIARIEKIEVIVKDLRMETDDITLVMNNNISTPYHCAKHISELLTNDSAVAELGDGTLWDMHRPITGDCTIRFRNFVDDQANEVNKIFWRSCSFLLGMVSIYRIRYTRIYRVLIN